MVMDQDRGRAPEADGEQEIFSSENDWLISSGSMPIRQLNTIAKSRKRKWGTSVNSALLRS